MSVKKKENEPIPLPGKLSLSKQSSITKPRRRSQSLVDNSHRPEKFINNILSGLSIAYGRISQLTHQPRNPGQEM